MELDYSSLADFVECLEEQGPTSDFKYDILKQIVLCYCKQQDRLHADYFSTLTELPLYKILLCLPSSDLGNLSQTCKRLEFICKDDILWKPRLYGQLLTYYLIKSRDINCDLWYGEGQGVWSSRLEEIVNVFQNVNPEFTWKWWYGKLRILFCGGDNSDFYSHIDVENLVKHWEEGATITEKFDYDETEYLDNKRLEHISYYEIRRAKYPYKFVTVRHSACTYRFLLDEKTKKYIEFSSGPNSYIVMVEKEYKPFEICIDPENFSPSRAREEDITTFDGMVIGPGFMCKGEYIKVRGDLERIVSFGCGTITWLHDGFSIPTFDLPELRFGQYTVNNLSNRLFLDTSHPKFWNCTTCTEKLNDPKISPQWFTEYGYCIPCGRAQCANNNFKDADDDAFSWNYNAGEMAQRCRCLWGKSLCNLKNNTKTILDEPMMMVMD